MTEFEKLIESVGLDAEKAKDFEVALAEAIDAQVAIKVQEAQDKFDVELTKKAAEYHKLAEEKATKAYEEKAAKLQEWHEYVIAEELAKVDEQLLVAKDVRVVREGLQKVIEGLNDAGIPLTQVFEAAVASEMNLMQESQQIYDEVIEAKEREAKLFQRAFIVSESTRDLTQIQKDAVIRQADTIDENLDAEDFKSIIEMIVEDKKASVKEDEAEKDAQADNKENAAQPKAKQVNESRFIGNAQDDNFDIKRFTTFR